MSKETPYYSLYTKKRGGERQRVQIFGSSQQELLDLGILKDDIEQKTTPGGLTVARLDIPEDQWVVEAIDKIQQERKKDAPGSVREWVMAADREHAESFLRFIQESPVNKPLPLLVLGEVLGLDKHERKRLSSAMFKDGWVTANRKITDLGEREVQECLDMFETMDG